MKKSRIVVFVLSSYTLGGAEKQLATLLSRRPGFARDLDVRTVTFLPTKSPELEAEFEAMGIRNTLVDRQSSGFPRFLFELVRTFRRLRPAIVHTLLDSSTGAWGRLAAWIARVPVIIHSDLSLMEEGTRAHFLLRPRLDRITQRFLPNAVAIAERLERSGVPRERITVIPCGVDLERFDPRTSRSLRGDWGISPDATVAGFLGRFAPVKRVDVLLDALVRVPEELRPDHVVFAGDGPTMPASRERIAADPWLRDHCLLLGAVHDVQHFLANIDYLVLPSEMEGLPNVILEAMAMGKPVVATAVSDIPRIIDEVGYTAEPGDPDALAAALRRMQQTPPTERAEMGRRARARIQEEYGLDDVAERFWRAHLNLLPSHGVDSSVSAAAE